MTDEDTFVNSEMKDVEGMVDPTTSAWRRQFSGIISGQVPLDDRGSLYLAWGDWFCWICAAATCVTMVIGFRRRPVATTEADSDSDAGADAT